ncbi:MAG TPA: helix-turn-helix domain-containing protein [Aldersonia sp.]
MTEPSRIAALLDAALVGAEFDDRDLAALRHDPDALDRLRVIRAELARLRRREHELGVLFASARELAEVRDLDTVLARLVTRAHDMMGTDVTYLSEFDTHTRDLRVRKSVGAVTPEFQHLRVPAGMGLASRIADTRTAQWVARYGDYTGGPHEDTIDAAVQAEGIVSILGVPMLAEGSVLGVLFAATRREHAFTAEETAMLQALASHASVVVQTARILDDLRASEDEARRALQRLTAHLEVRDRSNVVHQELVQAVLLGAGFEQVTRTIGDALGRTATIVDPEDVAAQAAVVRKAVATSRATGHCYFVEPTGPVQVVAAITAGESDFGALLLSDGDLALDEVDERTLERAAQVAALIALQRNAVADAARRVRGELIADLLHDAPERRRNLDRRVRDHGLVLADLNAVVVAVVAAEHRAAAASSIALGKRGLVGDHAGLLVAVLHSDDALADARDLRHRIQARLPQPVLTIAAAPAAHPDDLPDRFETALRTARVLAALGIDDDAVTTAAYQPYAVLFGADPDALPAFIDQLIRPVIDYDTAHGTDLVATLRAFVRNDASPTKTARALNYHPNTILQRLDRLKSLLGPDWRTDEHLFRISTAVRLDELRHRTPHP